MAGIGTTGSGGASRRALNIMRNRGFQSGERGQLRGQAAEGLRAGHGQAPEPST